MIKLFMITLMGVGCWNCLNNSTQFKPGEKGFITDTIIDPVHKTVCSLVLENTTIKIKSASFSNSTGNAIANVLIDSNHSIKEVEVIYITIIQNKEVVFRSSEKFEIVNNDQLKPIIVNIKRAINNGKITCLNNKKSSSKLRIPLKLLLD